jgi:hypothetical protein
MIAMINWVVAKKILRIALLLASFAFICESSAISAQFRSPSLHIVFFVPSDLEPPAGARERLTKVADACEGFFFNGMTRWGYKPGVTNLFQREPDGLVHVLNVRGESPVSSHKYDKPNYADAVIKQATEQYHISGKGDVWWIFVYLGDRPARFANFAGAGNPRDGGWAMVNYDTVPGEIRTDLGLAEGFNGEYFLKGTIHELGHAFGLPHLGPDVSLGLGNSLMGPATVVYARRHYPKPEQIYLCDASAAMLWKHPIFAGGENDASHLPTIKLVDCGATYNQPTNTVTVSGKIVADQHAHSVVLIDDKGKPNDQYWCQGHAARIDPNGAFQITIKNPAKVDGRYRILFCFDNGIVTGDGKHFRFVNRGDIQKSYGFNDGKFQFGDSAATRNQTY